MPPGLPSFLSFEDIISQASVQLRDYGMAEFPAGVLIQHASNANREFAAQSEVVKATASMTLVRGQSSYNLPEDAIRIEKVSVKYGSLTGFKSLQMREQEDTYDGWAPSQSGIPGVWYLSRNRKTFGFWPGPSEGGFEGVTTSAGSTTLINRTGVATVVNAYKNLPVRILDGVCEGETSVVVSNTVNSVTVAPAFTAVIASGVSFQVGQDTLLVDYIQSGNAYVIMPTAATVANVAGGGYAEPNARVFSVSTLPDRTRNFWNGCEVKFKSGSNNRMKARITSSRSKGAGAGQTEFTVTPPLPGLPVVTDTLVITDVPNIPDDSHHALVDFIVAHCASRYRLAVYDRHLARFDSAIKGAIETNQPSHGDFYHQSRIDRFHRWGRWR